MKKIALFIFCCMSIHLVRVSAQQQFQISYRPFPLQQTKYIAHANGGGYLLAADVTLSSGEKAIMLIRINDQFFIVWHKLINEPGVAERVRYFYQDSNGNIFIAGYIDATVKKALTIKTDSSANLLWKYIYNYGTFNSEAWRIYKSNTGSVFVTGYSQDTAFAPSNPNMALLMKLNSSGLLQWAKTFPSSFYSSYHGEMLPFSDGKLVSGGIDFSLNNIYGNLIKYDTLGNILWKHRYPNVDYATSSPQSTALNDITFSSSGDYIMYGSTNFILPNDRNYIMRCDSLGTILQYKVFTVPVNSLQRFISILSAIQTPDGGYAIAGSISNTGIVLLKMNSNLGLQWGRLYSGANYFSGANSLLHCSDGGYLIAGSYPQDSSITLIKTDTLGWSSCHESSIPIADSAFTFITLPPHTDIQIPLMTQSIYNGIMANNTNPFNTDSLCSTATFTPEEKFSDNAIFIFPNPFSVSATIRIYDFSPSTRGTIYDFVLYDILGREILVSELPRLPDGQGTADSPLERGNLKSGMYFYKVTGDKGQGAGEIIGMGKIVIE